MGRLKLNVRHKIYLDTHFIDYLWDHRAAIWEDDERSLRAARERDTSEQVEEYELLREFPMLAYWNEWFVTVGEEVFRQLEAIPDESRRENLLQYAEQIASMSTLSSEEPTASPGIHPERLDAAYLNASIDCFPRSDRAIIREAILRGCTVVLTTDRGVLREGRQLRELTGLRVQRLTEFVDEEAIGNRLGHPFGPEGPTSASGGPSLFPDISLYTWFIPPGDLTDWDETDD